MKNTKEQREYLFCKYETGEWEREWYFEKWVSIYKEVSTAKERSSHGEIYRIRRAKYRFLAKYKKWKIDHNSIMKKKRRTNKEPKRK